MEVWISKYALTQGIYEKEVERSVNHTDMVKVNTNNSLECYHGEGTEWHVTKELAINKAEEMRIKKIKSLEKQLEKLQSMKFE